jgi:DNA polymerase-3 subunit epsilon/ATP-dependent DNA helicase DinG
MRGEIVAIDLETTGLDPTTDAIIEFGAVRMVGGEIVAEYSTLINPGRPIPAEITALTGISDLDFAPRGNDQPEKPPPVLYETLPNIRSFVGDSPIIGHNVAFDLSFLYRQGLFQPNIWIDTYELASVILPCAHRYSLASLAQQLNVELPDHHRALNDARAAALLYWKLWEKLLGLPQSLILEIVTAAQSFEWNIRPVFEAAYQQTFSSHVNSLSSVAQPSLATQQTESNQSVEAPAAINLEKVRQIFKSSSKLGQSLPSYEARPQQLEMALKIAEAFNTSQHLMAEAGTGIGKSLAYLVPAALWSLATRNRVVISTNTINLQEQLLAKDIPSLQQALPDFTAVLLKGRGNYLCPRRLAILRRQRPSNIDELKVFAKVLVWLQESSSGDRSELNFRGHNEINAWRRFSAEEEMCSLDRCMTAEHGTCPFYRARKAAEITNLTIVNHALLLSDAVNDNQVIPDYQHLIIDEAHHLEEAATSSLSFRTDLLTLRQRLTDLGNAHRGIFGEFLDLLKPTISPRDFARFNEYVKTIILATNAMDTHLQSFFRAFRNLYLANKDPNSEYTPQIRITGDMRNTIDFDLVQRVWSTLVEFFDGTSVAMQRLMEAIARFRNDNTPELDDLITGFAAIARNLDEVRSELNELVTHPLDRKTYWMSLGPSDNLSLHTAPIHVGKDLAQYIWDSKTTVVLTSATLQTDNGFDYLQKRLSAEKIECELLESPFDYRQATLLYIPNDMPDPNDRNRYQQAVERGLIELASALDGRTLGLFTSYTQLRQTAQTISPRLALGNIHVYDQNEASNRQMLLDSFKATEKAVLLGTRAFWEGIDLPNYVLKAIVIARLPFPVPNDPIIAARAETYRDSFRDYMLPEAILRFRQGFGRLIRTQKDRGVVAIFDRRIMSRNYGKAFLDALPGCTVQYGTLQALPETAKKWLNGD